MNIMYISQIRIFHVLIYGYVTKLDVWKSNNSIKDATIDQKTITKYLIWFLSLMAYQITRIV